MNRRHPLPEGWVWDFPTEAQWEYACRAGRRGPYSGTGNLEEMGWYDGNRGGESKAVATKRENSWGLHDMHGNVWEWCRDWYELYPHGDATDPTGPSSGSIRVLRGGGWLGPAVGGRAAYRHWMAPDDRLSIFGFRAAIVERP